jgi:hypothetical protein
VMRAPGRIALKNLAMLHSKRVNEMRFNPCARAPGGDLPSSVQRLPAASYPAIQLRVECEAPFPADLETPAPQGLVPGPAAGRPAASRTDARQPSPLLLCCLSHQQGWRLASSRQPVGHGAGRTLRPRGGLGAASGRRPAGPGLSRWQPAGQGNRPARGTLRWREFFQSC